MKKFYTQTGYMWGIRFIAIFAFALSLILIFVDLTMFLLMLFAVMLYLMSYIGCMSRILIYDEFIDVKMVGVGGKFLKSELGEIVVYGCKFSYGMTNIDLYFKRDGKIIRGVRTQSHKELIRELLKYFNGNIRFETEYVEEAKEQMILLGAKMIMFN